MSDLDEAIVLFEKTLQLHPPGHSARGVALSNLAAAMGEKYVQDGSTNLDEIIALYEQALEIHPVGYLAHDGLLNNLGIIMQKRYQQSGNSKDLDQAIILLNKALQLQLPGHSRRISSLTNLTSAIYQQYQISGDPQARTQIMNELQASLNHIKCSVSDRLALAQSWADYAKLTNDSSMLKAFQTALTAMEAALVIAPNFADQHEILRKYSDLGVNAVSIAIQSNQEQAALEFLEQGRALLWSQIQGFKSHSVFIRAQHNALEQEFITLTQKLEQLAMTFPQELNTTHPAETFCDHVGNMYREKADLKGEKQLLISRIRLQPGYESFMKLPSFDLLQHVASEGPIIIINCSMYQSHGIILYHDKIVTVPLSDEFYREMETISDTLLIQRKHIEDAPEWYSLFLAESMEQIWEILMEPIIEELEKLQVPQQSHIWWCPTSFVSNIPLHAAGPKPGSKKKQYFCDIYVSSYTPTLMALINARSSQAEAQLKSGSITLLAVTQTDESLCCTNEEVSVLQSLPRVSFSSLTDSDATQANVTEKLGDCSWVHFACHGELKDKEPFNAAFVLHGDERLTLVDIIKANMPKAQFAFLSACHTAELTEGSASEEVLHLAAAMHFCGFPSVVGTLWQMNDADGPNLAREFYKHMLAEPTEKAPEVGLRRAARSLNLATRTLRKKHKVGIERWANFVHIGL